MKKEEKKGFFQKIKDYSNKVAEFLKKVKEKIPEQWIPGEITSYSFEIIFLVFLLLSLFQIPFGAIFAGNVDAKIGMGIPFHFISFDFTNPNNNPIAFKGLFLDVLSYLVASYAINVIINYLIIWKRKRENLEKKEKTKPRLYKIEED
jgi:hypothetical protein